MTLLPVLTPGPPDWGVDWEGLNEKFEWVRALKDCPQDPVYHAEGDVWIHSRMVCEALAGMDEWRALPELERAVLFTAALLHDVAKPLCTRFENGRLSCRGHSQRGALQARQILWRCGAELELREQVCALIRYHQRPFHLIERRDALRMLRLVSQSTRCDLLAILARADALGRYCDDQAELLTKIALFRELCADNGCLHQPWPFPSALSRFEYFRHEGRDPDYQAYDETRFEVILMSGLPSAGKDSWIGAHAASLPTVSLDQIREESGGKPVGKQSAVVQIAKEQARILLRKGSSFVWNATNVSSEIRGQLINLFTAYKARVRVIYVEAPYERLIAQNRERGRAVPVNVIQRMMDRWEIPDITEAPQVEWWENCAGWAQRFPTTVKDAARHDMS